jgi:hypothetical protein
MNQECEEQLGNDRGNPGVAKVNPDPYPLKTRTLVEGMGF